MNANDLPLVLTPRDVKAILRCGERRVYELIHSQGFPAIQDRPRGRIIIPRDALLRWLDEEARRNTGEPCRGISGR